VEFIDQHLDFGDGLVKEAKRRELLVEFGVGEINGAVHGTTRTPHSKAYNESVQHCKYVKGYKTDSSP